MPRVYFPYSFLYFSLLIGESFVSPSGILGVYRWWKLSFKAVLEVSLNELASEGFWAYAYARRGPLVKTTNDCRISSSK
jgi:hypothetical protein